jgi:hypothetical protein
MEILVAIVLIALIAAVAFVVIQRRPGGVRGLSGPRPGPLDRRGTRTRTSDPMAAAVAEHAQVTDPAEVPAAEQRLKEQARRVAAPMQAEALRAEHQRAADQMADGVIDANYVEGSPAPVVRDPAADPRYDDPDRIDPEYDGRVDPRYDDRQR